MSPSAKPLVLLLRVVGCLDLLAVTAVCLPTEGIDALHRFAGLGPLPEGPIVGYLARAASAMYVLYGALLLFISGDVARYARLIRFLGWAAIVHGAVLLVLDCALPLPFYWRLLEGPGFAGIGAMLLYLQHRTGTA